MLVAYSLRPKLLAKSWLIKESYKIHYGLEDPKQATIHLALALQLKQDGGIQKIRQPLFQFLNR